uniref:Protein kinase domain-containing protein n=1 Tax=Aegilops tauschii subsp. strangulata TaxID=200361 RepID=A0A453GTU5_AEGTS
MAQSSGSESSGGGKDNDGSTRIPFTLHRVFRDDDTSLCSLYLEMPSGMEDISKSYAYPKVFLLVNDKDKSQKDCLKMMHNLIHENVLGVKFWEEVEGEPYIRVYVEPYTAFVSELLKNAEFAVHPIIHSVPSRDFRKMVWAAINALDYIRESGNYHGNFSWRTTLYHEANGNIVVKLAYFERKRASLEAVSRHVRNNYAKFQNQTCCLIDDLASKLKSVTKFSVGTAKHDLEDHDFFWDEKRTKMFFAYEVPKIFKNEAVKNRFRALPTCPTLPWKTKWSPDPLSDPILIEMEKYRAKHGLGQYNENSFEDFLRFISGMYTHENLLRKQIENLVVDAEVRVRFPRLSYDLNTIIRGAA